VLGHAAFAAMLHCLLACHVIDVPVVKLLMFVCFWSRRFCSLTADAVTQGIARQRQAIVNGLRESVSLADTTASY